MSVIHDHDPWAKSLAAFWRGVRLALLFIFAICLGLTIKVGVWGYNYLATIARASGMSLGTMVQVAKQGWNLPVRQADGRVNFLILGIDTLGNRNSDQVMTDTLMVISLNLKTGVLTTFSLPRDLYLTDAKVKINGLYQQAKTRGINPPQILTQQEVEKLTGLPIHYTVMLEINEIGKVVDAIGGLDIAVERSFTDARFPREEVDASTETDPTKLYKTIEFTQGIEHMNGQRATEFIRSRHSSDPQEGSDDARVKRQQQVISALVRKLEDKGLLKQPYFLGMLLRLYREDMSRYIPLPDALALGRQFIKIGKLPVMRSYQLPVQGMGSDPVLYHPDRFPGGAWVYLPLDPTGKQIANLISSWLQ